MFELERLGVDSPLAVLGTALGVIVAVALVTAASLRSLPVEETQFAISTCFAPILWAASVSALVPASRGTGQHLLSITLISIAFLTMFGYALGWRLKEERPR